MQFKLYQMQIAAGVVFGGLLTLFHLGLFGQGYGPLMVMLEPASFGFCALGIVTGGRVVRTQFLALSSDKTVARADPAHMKDRWALQLSCVPACAAMASLLGARYNVNPLYTWLALPIILIVVLLIINRLSGWTTR